MSVPKTQIAICAPARPIDRTLAREVSAFAAQEFPGVTLAFHEQCFAQAGHFAGDDARRLSALLDCANDPQVDAVWSARGGYGSNRIAAAAVAGMGAAARDKVFLGYSDFGYVLAALYRAGIGRPVHGPMPVDWNKREGRSAVRRALSFLSGKAGDGLEPSLDQRPTVAFNLTTLAMLVGTELMPDLAGHVVMVEEVDECLYAVDRLFFHLMPFLKGIAGLRLGRVDEKSNDVPFGATAEQITRDWCARAGIPFLGRAEIGHDAANRIVPFGLAAARAEP